MLHTGLASITFNQLSPAEVISLVSKAKLEAIEWGGKVHVPHGNLKIASEVKKMTWDGGLKICSYGSYYLVGEDNSFTFEQVLDCAVELDAPVIRVWPGRYGADIFDQSYRSRVVNDSLRMSALAAQAGKTVSYEFHNGYLTDTAESTLDLLTRINAANFTTYWQPRASSPPAEHLDTIKMLFPWITNVHAFHLGPDGKRIFFHDGLNWWQQFIGLLRRSQKNIHILLEIVNDNDPRNFLADAAELKRIVESASL
jgi:3-dehydroshikimate dehydratase